MPLCECDCGGETSGRPGIRFIRGHGTRMHKRTKEHCENLSKAKSGKNHQNYGKRGKDVPSYKNGRMVHKGYVYILVDETHPYFCMAKKGGRFSNYIPEHRLVMAEHLGRPLVPNEHVHHRLKYEGGSGDTTDNNIENLVLMEHSDHIKHHWKIRKEILLAGGYH